MKKFAKISLSVVLVIGVLAASIALRETPRAQAATFTLAQAIVTNSVATSAGTYTVAFGSSIAVGHAILCAVTNDDNNPGETTSLTDSLGNTYTKDFEVIGATREVSLWRAPVTVSGTPTVTVHYNVGDSSASAVACEDWSFGTGTLTPDQQKGGTGTATALTTGASPATTAANELVFVGSVNNSTNTTCTAGTGYSNVGFKLQTNANVCVDSLETSITGAQTGLQTWTTSRAYAIGLETYSVVTGGGGGGSGGGSPGGFLLFGDW